MAKVSFNKLTAIKTAAITQVQINSETVEVLTYLPIDKKSELIKELISLVIDDTSIKSPIRHELYSTLLVVKYYTNINFTDTMMTNIERTYDLLKLNNIVDLVYDAIPEKELDDVLALIDDSIQAIYDYRTSALGILKETSKDVDLTNVDINSMMEQLQTLSTDSTLKDVLENFN